jgi:hypothetical protein
MQEEVLQEGHEVYKVKQAGYMKGMQDHFSGQWKDTAKFIANAREMYTEIKADKLAPEGEGGGNEDKEDEEDENNNEEEQEEP